MDIGIIIALSGIGFTMVGVVIAMMFWSRTEANSMRSEQKEDRRDLIQISRNLENTVLGIREDMKDFHERLLKLEAKRK